MGTKARILLLLVVFSFLAPATANALDIPLLTWERGRQQEIVLGGEESRIEWTIRLEGQGIEPILFRKSTPNEAGYFVYVADIPADLPLGAYTLSTEGMGLPKNVVASVNVIDNFFFSITNVPRDLIFVIALFNFAVASFSVLRASRYSRLHPIPSYLDELQGANKASGVTGKFLRLRTRISATLRESIFKYFVNYDQHVLARINPTLPLLLPLLGLVLVFFTALQVESYGDISRVPALLLALLSLIGLFDLFSATILSAVFWFTQLALGNVTSFRDAMVMISVALMWVLPGLLRNVYHQALSSRGKDGSSNFQGGVFFAVIVAVATFFFANKLIDSVLISVTTNRDVSAILLMIVGVASVARLLMDGKADESDKLAQEKFNIARVSSPFMAFIMFTLLFGYGYMWSEDSERSLLFAGLFAFPFLLLAVRFTEILIPKLAGMPRNIVLESLAVAGISAAIYIPIRNLPLLGDQKSQLFMLLCAIPTLLHSLYSALADHAERVRKLETQ